MILIKGATLIDGTGRPAIPVAAIVIAGDTFKWVGPASELDKTWRFDKTVDATGAFIIPGLIDAHTHICWDGRVRTDLTAGRSPCASVLIAI